MKIVKGNKLKFVAVYAVLLLCVTSLFLTGFTVKAATANSVSGIDFVQINDTISMVKSDNITTLTIKDDPKSILVYGDQNDYKVNFANLKWALKIKGLNEGGQIAISFVNSRAAKPFAKDADTKGISFLFKAVSANTIDSYIVDAKDGSLVDELKNIPYGYFKDGYFTPGESLPADEKWSNGKLGSMADGDTFIDKILLMQSTFDGASAGGTTFRPSVGGSSLGVSVPITAFESRELDIKNLTIMLTVGGINENLEQVNQNGGDIVLEIGKVDEKNTKVYNASATRSELISSVNSYFRGSEQAVLGELSEADYKTITAQTFDLGALRTADKVAQQQIINKAQKNLEDVTLTLGEVKTKIQPFATAMASLDVLADVTKQKVDAADAAKVDYERYLAFVKYMSGSARTEVDNIINGINLNNLDRAKLHMAILEYETAVNAFDADATPAQILNAEHKKSLINTSKLDSVDPSDKELFLSRIKVCDNKVSAARVGKDFDIEDAKIDEYNTAVNALSHESTFKQISDVFALRPQLVLGGIMPGDKAALIQKMQAVDDAFGTILKGELTKYYANYKNGVDDLANSKYLTQSKIDVAKQLVYNAENVNAIKAMAQASNVDILQQIEQLTECDRLLTSAEARIFTAQYAQKALGALSASDLQSVYDLREVAVQNEDKKSILTQAELKEVNDLFAEADTNFSDKAKAIIQPLLVNFEATTNAALDNMPNVKLAKEARAAVPDVKFIINDTNKEYANRFNAANAKLLASDYYYVTIPDGSSWSAKSTNTGLEIEGKLNDGVISLQDPLNIDGFDMVFDFSKIGRIWKGEDPVGSGKYPSSILVVNIMRNAGTIKGAAQGFSIYFYANHLQQLEVMVYGAIVDGQEKLLAQGIIDGCGFGLDNYKPYDVRIRINKMGAPLNCYKVWVNSLSLNLFYRDFINLPAERPEHIPEFVVGDEIGEKLFKDDLAYVTFVMFGSGCTPEESISSFTIKMIGSKTFAGYVAPLFMTEINIVNMPTKLTYEKGEKFDILGLKMTRTLSDGTVSDVDNSKVKILGFSSTSKGVKNVTLSYTEGGITFSKVIKVTIVDTAGDAATNPKGANIGLIIGLSVGGVALVAGIVVLCVYFLVIKKSKNKAKK